MNKFIRKRMNKFIRKRINMTIWCACGFIFPVVCSAAPQSGSGDNKGAATVVGVENVSEIEDFETRHYTGQVVSCSVVNIVPQVSGEILEVGFKDGGVVRKGQMLYRLDSVQYEAAVKGVEADIEKYKAELDYAQSNFNRLDLLYQQNATSLDTVENAKATLGAAKAALLAAEADLITAKDNLKNTVITAPQEGIVGVSAYTPGNYITPSSGTLLTIIQTQPIRVRFSLSTADLLAMFGSHKELLTNGNVEVKLADGSALGECGTIELLNNEVNPKTDAIQIYANFPNAEHKLLTGSTLSVTLSRKNGKFFPAVSPSALMHDSEGSYVYVLDSDRKVEKRYVVLGNSTPRWQLITGGLKAGEVVVTKGSHKVLPGMTVEADYDRQG